MINSVYLVTQNQENTLLNKCNYKNCFDKNFTPSEECDDGNLIDNDGCTNC